MIHDRAARRGLARLAPAIAVATALAGCASAAVTEGPAVTVTPLLVTTTTASGQPLALPAGDPELIVSIYEIPPGASLPVHRHPFQRYAYVLEGTLSVTEADTGTRYEYGAGEFVVEVVGTWHSGTSTGTVPLKLLVIDQVEEGAAATELR